MYNKHEFKDGEVLLASQLNDMDEKISSLDDPVSNMNFSEDYINELNNVISSVSAIQKNDKSLTTQFIIFSDLHKNTVSSHPEFYRMMNAIKYLTYKLNIKFVASMGDNIDTPVENTNYGVYTEIVDNLKEMNCPYINIMGNHDWVASVYKRNWLTNIPEAKFDSVGAWCYFDDEKTQIRYIVLDCQDRGNDANDWTSVTTASGGVSDRSYQQLDWLANVALKTDKKIILLGHQSLGVKQGNVLANTSNTDNYFIASLILQDFELGGSGESTYTKYYSDEVTAKDKVTWDFTQQGNGTILFNIHGHTHGDMWYNKNYTTDTRVQGPFNELVIDDAIYNSNTYIGKANTKTLNTVNEIIFDIVSVDLLNNTVNTFRFGAGQNRKCILNGECIYSDY